MMAPGYGFRVMPNQDNIWHASYDHRVPFGQALFQQGMETTGIPSTAPACATYEECLNSYLRTQQFLQQLCVASDLVVPELAKFAHPPYTTTPGLSHSAMFAVYLAVLCGGEPAAGPDLAPRMHEVLACSPLVLACMMGENISLLQQVQANATTMTWADHGLGWMTGNVLLEQQQCERHKAAVLAGLPGSAAAEPTFRLATELGVLQARGGALQDVCRLLADQPGMSVAQLVGHPTAVAGSDAVCDLVEKLLERVARDTSELGVFMYLADSSPNRVHPLLVACAQEFMTTAAGMLVTCKVYQLATMGMHLARPEQPFELVPAARFARFKRLAAAALSVAAAINPSVRIDHAVDDLVRVMLKHSISAVTSLGKEQEELQVVYRTVVQPLVEASPHALSEEQQQALAKFKRRAYGVGSKQSCLSVFLEDVPVARASPPEPVAFEVELEDVTLDALLTDLQTVSLTEHTAEALKVDEAAAAAAAAEEAAANSREPKSSLLELHSMFRSMRSVAVKRNLRMRE